MTEVDITKDLECCSKKQCCDCTREGEVGCSDNLAKDAMRIIKLQKIALDTGSKAINKLKADNQSLQGAVRYNFTEAKLVAAVNSIVHYCLDNDEDEEGNEYINLIHAMLDFVKMLPSGGKLVIRNSVDAPEIVLGK